MQVIKSIGLLSLGVIGFVGFIGFIVVGFVEIVAIFKFFTNYMHWSWVVSGIASFLIGYIPIIGGCIGVYATIEIWHWEWWWGVLLFFWPYLFAILEFFVDRLNDNR